ncbi:MAG: dephospho-CoA kinase [Pseudomonadota bacterium]
MTQPKIIGLTGSIGMGKSTVATMFKKAGIPIFDADAEVRQMQGPAGELIPAIEAAFPGSTGPDGVNREALGKLVFTDKEKLSELEAIVHPAVGQKRVRFLEKHSSTPLVLFDIPLLFEGSGYKEVDYIVVVSASADVQRERVLSRPGMTSDKFEHVLGLQTPDSEKRDRADYVIDTWVTLQQTEEPVRDLIKTLTADL